MRIENEVKLDYKDVLIRPKRSILRSRKEVILRREYKFRNSGGFWSGIPIVAANMDGVGTFNMAHELSRAEMFTCITKQTPPKEWYNLFGQIDTDHLAISVGTKLKRRPMDAVFFSPFNYLIDDLGATS